MSNKSDLRERIARRLLYAFLVISVLGFGAVAYWLYFRIQEVRIAVSNPAGEDTAILNAVNDWMISDKRHYRLKLVFTGSPDGSLQKLRQREVDFAILRGDRVQGGGVSSVMVMFSEVAGVVMPEKGSVKDWGGLQKVTIGVPRGTAPDDPLLLTLLRLNGVPSPRITSLEADAVRMAFERKQVQAIGFVSPLPGYASVNFDKYFPQKLGDLTMPTVDSPDLLAAKDKRYLAATIVAGSLRASPSVPDEAIGTLSVGRHMLVRSETNNFLVARFVRTMLDAKRALFSAQPLFRQAGAPDTEADAFIKVHDAAKKIYNGDEPSWGDIAIEWIYIVPMIVGALGSIGIWMFQRYIHPEFADPSVLVSDLLDIRSEAIEAEDEPDLSALGARVDEIADKLNSAAYDYSEIDGTNAVLTAILLAEHQISERRRELRDAGFSLGTSKDHKAAAPGHGPRPA